MIVSAGKDVISILNTDFVHWLL